jgi:site-specific recombinase XerD
VSALAEATPAGGAAWTVPLPPARYDRSGALSAEEHHALGLIARSPFRWPAEAAPALSRLTGPIDDVLDFVSPRAVWWARSPARGALLGSMRQRGTAFWGWGREDWLAVLAETHSDVRQLAGAVAYLLCGQRDLHREFRGWKAGLFARRVFGAEPVEATLGHVQSHLDGLGQATQLGRPQLAHALFQWMLLAGSPLLCDLARRGELLAELRAGERHNGRRHGIEQLARTLVEMGTLASLPFGAEATREEWLDRSRAQDRDVPAEWLGWTRRWFSTSTLTPPSRRHVYYTLIKAGRWLAREHPDRVTPGAWTRELAAGWVAAVDQFTIGELAHAPNTEAFMARRGGPLGAATKAQHIYALRTFFVDLQEWGWIERRFDPARAFSVPRSVRALIGPDPRVIADDVWAKLLWAGLNLTAADQPRHANRAGGHPFYPLELIRALALLWLFGGLRVAEIMRLRVGSIRWQHDNQDADTEPVCLLEVPTNKTGTAFTKPVDRTVGEAIEAWERARPPQPRFTDRKTGEQIDLLFAFRGAPVSDKYVNRSLIPLLCRKAGVPRADARGPITGHRARATIASQLYNAKDPMSLFELKEWLGHRSVHSTQHYARITPTTLAKAYSEAGYFARNLRAIEVLLDRDQVQSGGASEGEPFEFYDLGHGYCSYSFFEQCPHRMACARCDFYLPKQSSRAQLLEAKHGTQRLLVEIPLTDDERAAVEGDQHAVERLIDLLADSPTPAGPTPRELEHSGPAADDDQSRAPEAPPA